MRKHTWGKKTIAPAGAASRAATTASVASLLSDRLQQHYAETSQRLTLRQGTSLCLHYLATTHATSALLRHRTTNQTRLPQTGPILVLITAAPNGPNHLPAAYSINAVRLEVKRTSPDACPTPAREQRNDLLKQGRANGSIHLPRQATDRRRTTGVDATDRALDGERSSRPRPAR